MIRDDYAGAGGWSEGLRLLGLRDVGIEWTPEACATRRAASHLTIRADLASFERWTRYDGYIASPPCQTFSVAGKGDGAQVLPELVAAITAGEWDAPFDDRTRHVLRTAMVCDRIDADWIALEQVPPVLPIWQAIARRLDARGFSTWCGVLCAADFGVPQTRRRAFLLASRVRAALPPEPTHSQRPEAGLFGSLSPWVSMADALGWGMTERPYYTLALGGDSPDTTGGGSGGREGLRRAMWSDGWLDRPQQVDGVPVRMVPTSEPAPSVTASWVWEHPATTVAADPRITARCHHDKGSQGADAKTTEQVRAGDYQGTEPIRLTVTEAAVLQSFPDDYPWHGSRTAQFLQIGNAVPPLLAAHVVASLTGRSIKRREAA